MLRGPLRNSEALLTSSQGTPPRDWARGVNLKDYSNILLGVKKIISSKVGFFPFLFFFFFFLVELNTAHSLHQQWQKFQQILTDTWDPRKDR